MAGMNGLAGGELSGINVLMLDSDPNARTIAGTALRDAGCRDFIQTGDGQRALEVIETRAVEVVLMDCRQAAPAGISFLRKLRQTGIGKRMPVIIITSSDSGEEAWVARHLKVAAWLAKPCQPNTMLAQVACVLKRGTQRPETATLGTLADAYENRLPAGLQNLAQIATRVQTGHRGFADCAEEILALLLQLKGYAGVLGYTLIDEFSAILHDLQRLAVQNLTTIAPMQPELTRLLRVVAASMVTLTENKLRGMAGPAGQLISDQLRTPMLDLRTRFEDSIANAESKSRAMQDAMAVRQAEMESESWRLRRTITIDGTPSA